MDRSGALPMLTPPSDAAAEDRPSKGRHSPVPFRLNSLTAAAEAPDGGDGAGDAPAAGAGAEQQQQHRQQPVRQNISQIFRKQHQRQQLQQQERPGNGAGSAGSSQGGLLGGSSSHISAAAPAASGHTPSRLRGAAGSSGISPPQLPEDGAAPGSTFWKQLVGVHCRLCMTARLCAWVVDSAGAACNPWAASAACFTMSEHTRTHMHMHVHTHGWLLRLCMLWRAVLVAAAAAAPSPSAGAGPVGGCCA